MLLELIPHAGKGTSVFGSADLGDALLLQYFLEIHAYHVNHYLQLCARSCHSFVNNHEMSTTGCSR